MTPLRRAHKYGAIARAGIVFSLDKQCALAGLPMPEPEFQFARHLPQFELAAIGLKKPRRWALDWAFVMERLAVEVEGGYAIGGRHTTVKGFLGDLEKYAVLTCLRWRLLRVTPRQVANGEALEWIKRALPASVSAPHDPLNKTSVSGTIVSIRAEPSTGYSLHNSGPSSLDRRNRHGR